ncbi:hypothetical protein ElyMa_004858300 [Elysia marginata]|uniref:Uncharacterized protein n=1 Tax=Elysia marginata TaxID=1093978 RepID=A0AAV4ISJ8_9GAST|nr:hypothetical protein ElyMa_004858300 [Elysia marginata]
MSLITQYKKERQSADSDDSGLPDKLNELCAVRHGKYHRTSRTPIDNDPPFLITEPETNQTMRALARLNVIKAAGLDNTKSRILSAQDI